MTEQGYSVTDTASAVGVRPNQNYNWKKRLANESSGIRLTGEEREELIRLQKENKKRKIEKEILKKQAPTLRRK